MVTASRLARFVASKEWPDVQTQKKYADGAFWFTCAGHGGTVVLLDKFAPFARKALREAGLTAKVVEANGKLYYSGEYKLDDYEGVEVAVGEEDCGWAVLFVAKPALAAGYEAYGKTKGFLPADYSVYGEACDSARNWSPDAYEALTGDKLLVEESYVLTKRKFAADNAGNYVTRSAYGDWHDSVPEGKVGVLAKRESDGDEGYFLVDKDEYGTNGGGSFVVDLDRHERVEAWG